MDYTTIESLPREKLLELCQMYAKNWLAHDGLWFQSIEEKRGMEEAIEHDINAWEKLTRIEAKRIKAFLGLGELPGLEGLAQALRFRLYASLNEDEITLNGDTLIYKVVTCRVQHARKRKDMDYFPCKPVGMVEYAGFANEIDCRITMEPISCHPDVTDESCNCMWKFVLKSE